jgi:hypothetical protein
MWFIHNSNPFAMKLQPLESYLFHSLHGPRNIQCHHFFIAIPKYMEVFVYKLPIALG